MLTMHSFCAKEIQSSIAIPRHARGGSNIQGHLRVASERDRTRTTKMLKCVGEKKRACLYTRVHSAATLNVTIQIPPPPQTLACLLPYLLPPILAHGENLHHADKDVDKVELKVDGLVNGVLRHEALLRHARVVQHLLHVVQSEAAKHGETAVQPDVLGPHERARGCGRDHHGCEAGESDDGDTSEKRAAEVHVLVCLGCRADKRERSHHSSCVETGAGEDGGVHEKERRQEHGLRDVEGGPESVLLNIAVGGQSIGSTNRLRKHLLVGVRRHRAVHGSNAADETYTKHQPRVGTHQPKGPSVHVQCTSRNSDHTNTETSVHECVVQVCPLKRGHATVLSRLAVENEVDLIDRQ